MLSCSCWPVRMLERVVKAVIRGSVSTLTIIDEDAVAEVVSVINEVIV